MGPGGGPRIPRTLTSATVKATRRVMVIRLSLSGGVAAASLVGAIVGPELVGQSRAQDLIGVVATAGVPRGLTDQVLAPHHVLVVDDVLGPDGQARPADAVEGVAGIHTDLTRTERRHALRRIGPGGREHADRAHLADLVVEALVPVAMNVGDVGEGLEDLVDFPPVADPEVPGRVILPQRVVAEENHGPVLRPAGEGPIQPGELVPAHSGPGPGDAAVEDGHVAHSLPGRHLLDGPEVGGAADRVEPDEPHAFVIEGPRRVPEELLPLHAHVEIPVVLAGDVELLDRHLFEDLGAELELHRVAELGDVAADDEEVGRGRHRLAARQARLIAMAAVLSSVRWLYAGKSGSWSASP